MSFWDGSGTWDLIDCPAELSLTKKNFSEIRYNIKLRRKTLFYTVNLLTPCVLISFLSVLTFYLPADAQEKVTLCISILLALVVFLLCALLTGCLGVVFLLPRLLVLTPFGGHQ